MTEETTDPRYLTFSQAQGYEELPQPLALGVIGDDTRIKLWDLLASYVWVTDPSHVYLNKPWYQILGMAHSDFLKKPADEFEPDTYDTYKFYKQGILHNFQFNRLFDLFQMIMRHPQCPRQFTSRVAEVFNKGRLAYVVDTQTPATILPAATKLEGQTVVKVIDEFRASGLRGTEAHIRNAAELINSGQWADSVRESIHAVESVARQLDPDASKKLGPALSSLEKKGQLHPALKKAFSSLYGYTSDEEGVRHPLVTHSTARVNQDEAVFMLGACASFASYLWRRHQTGNAGSARNCQFAVVEAGFEEVELLDA